MTPKKEVTQLDDVRRVEDELTKALLKLAAAWPFAGGSHLMIDSRELISSPRFESNANAIEQQLLARDDLKSVKATFGIPVMTGATYAQPPLALAIQIAKLTRVDIPARRLVQYYYRSWIDRGPGMEADAGAWCLNLYKVRDLLGKLYKRNAKAKAARVLGIQGKDWDKFGSLLNQNDRRHAELTGISPPISPPDIGWLYDTARMWISSYLHTKGCGQGPRHP